MAEFDCSGGWTQKEKKEIAALMRLENKLAENEKRLRHDVRRLDEELSAARQSHQAVLENLGYARIERLVHEVIADCGHLSDTIRNGGMAAIGSVIPFVENYFNLNNRWERLHRTLKTCRLPSKQTSMLSRLPMSINETWRHLEELVQIPEVRQTNRALANYLDNWHYANRPVEHWKDDAFKAKVDDAWHRFRDTLEPLVERLRELKPGRKVAAAKPKPPTPRRTVSLKKPAGVVCPYAVEPEKQTITCKATGKTYRITGDKAVRIVNRLMDGLVKGLKKRQREKGKDAALQFSVAFTDADARVFRKGKHGHLPDFMRDCIVRDPFNGHRIGNQRFADPAHLTL